MVKIKGIRNDYIFKKIPTGSNWKKMLLEIYRISPHYYGESHKISLNDNKHPLARKLKISGCQLMLGFSFLHQHKLIEYKNNNALDKINDDWSSQIYLTEKGFNVASNLEKHYDSVVLQYGIGIFTGMLVLTGAAELIYGISKPNNPLIFLIVYGFIILLIGSLSAYKIKTSIN